MGLTERRQERRMSERLSKIEAQGTLLARERKVRRDLERELHTLHERVKDLERTVPERPPVR